MHVCKVAAEWRAAWGKDVVIDLVSFTVFLRVFDVINQLLSSTILSATLGDLECHPRSLENSIRVLKCLKYAI